MNWMQEPGFENFTPLVDYLYLQIDCLRKNLPPGCKPVQAAEVCGPKICKDKFPIVGSWVSPNWLDSDLYELLPNSLYGIFAGQPQVIECVPNFKFNCFITRMDPTRQGWLYQLERRKLFDLGLISFNMDISRHTLQNKYPPGTTPHYIFESQFQQFLQIFQKEHAVLKSKVPYRNFSDSLPLSQIIMQTEFSIVLETYFDNNNIIVFSEKIFRCLKLPRPWVLFAMKNAVAYLRDMGFDVLDDLVDHSYDSIDYHIDRQIAILDQIEIMCTKTLSEAQIQRCQQAADHNQQLLFELKSRFHDDVKQTCERAIIKCLKSQKC